VCRGVSDENAYPNLAITANPLRSDLYNLVK
jgi:hypothetical protein